MATKTKKHPPMSDDEIRDHLEANQFHGIWVSQRNIEEFRRLMKIPKR